LADQGVIETIGRGRGTRYILSRQFYVMTDRKGVYTRKRGLDRETNKALLLKHIRDNAGAGVPLNELFQVLPALSRYQIQRLLQELRDEGLTRNVGTTKASRWFPTDRPTDGGKDRHNAQSNAGNGGTK
jgi:ATP-dependent DNA helicase RecG